MFFQKLAELLAKKANISVSKTDDTLTVSIFVDGKTPINFSGAPVDLDEQTEDILSQSKEVLTKKPETVTTSVEQTATIEKEKEQAPAKAPQKPDANTGGGKGQKPATETKVVPPAGPAYEAAYKKLKGNNKKKLDDLVERFQKTTETDMRNFLSKQISDVLTSLKWTEEEINSYNEFIGKAAAEVKPAGEISEDEGLFKKEEVPAPSAADVKDEISSEENDDAEEEEQTGEENEEDSDTDNQTDTVVTPEPAATSSNETTDDEEGDLLF